MRRRTADRRTTVAQVNGWQIVRDRLGAGTRWYAQALCPAGYQIAIVEAATRRAAEAHARGNAAPAPVPPSAEIMALRARNSATMARLMGAA